MNKIKKKLYRICSEVEQKDALALVALLHTLSYDVMEIFTASQRLYLVDQFKGYVSNRVADELEKELEDVKQETL